MNIFFDVDYTIIDYAGALRPFVKEVFAQLKADGHTLYLWSGVGIRTEVVEQHKLHEFISGLYWKPRYNYRSRLTQLGVPLVPDFVVDDHVGVVHAFGGYCIRPYGGYYDQNDQEMRRAYEAIADHVSAGRAEAGKE